MQSVIKMLQPEQKYPHTNLADFLYIAAAKVPDKVCIETDSGCYTYAQMVRMTESIRLVLRRALLRCPECQIPAVDQAPPLWERRKDEHAICIVLDRGPECVATVHATMLERCVYNTFDAAEPREKLKCWIEIAEHPVMITSRPVMDRLGLTENGWTFGGDFPRFVLNVHEILEKGEAKVDQAPPPTHRESDMDRLCYIIFTSGSTGKPKAVMIQHKSACNLVRVWSDVVGLQDTDRAAQMASMAFDNHVPEVYGTMYKLCTSVVVPDVMKRSGPDMLGWLADKHVNLMVTVPSHLRSMLGPGVDVSTVALPHLRVLDIGGEALGRDVLDTWAPGRSLFNIYGPTEVTVVCAGCRVEPGDEITIGYDLPTYTNKVLNADTLEECPPGERGVLYTGGIGCARGYLDDEEKTNGKFVQVPRFGRMYCSGDVVSQDSIGRFVYHGRADWQVKVRGIRIELEALEEAVGNVTGVKHCESRVTDEGRKLVMIVSGPNPVEADVKQAASKLGKGYTLSEVKIVDQSAWKFNTSGKLVRNHVPLEDQSSEGADGKPKDSWSCFVQEGASELEIEIAKCVAQFVKAEKEWTTEAHFIEDLGLDSSGFGKLITLLRRKPALKAVNLPTLFENPTVALLGAVVEGQKEDESDESDGEDEDEALHQRASDAPEDLLHIFLSKCIGWPLQSRASSAATNLLARIPIPSKMIPAASDRRVHALCAEGAGGAKTYMQVFHLAMAMQTLLRRAERDAESEPEEGLQGIVVIALPAELEQIAAMLAVLLQRRAFAVVDHTMNGERLKLRLEVAQATAIFAHASEVAQGKLENIISDLTFDCGIADLADLPGILAKPMRARRPRETERPLSCVAFSQGSTGHTKAATFSHAAMSWAARSLSTTLGISSSERVLQLFDGGDIQRVACTWAAFSAGAALMLPPAGTTPGAGLRAWLLKRRVSAIGAQPSDLRALGSQAASMLPCVRLVWISGAACPKDLALMWAQSHRFVQIYCKNELPGACALQVTGGDALDSTITSLPYGQAMPGCHLLILDVETLRPVPHGQKGVLFVSSPGLAKGYLDTVENDDGFLEFDGLGRLFCTGEEAHQGMNGLEITNKVVATSGVIRSMSIGTRTHTGGTAHSTPRVDRARSSLSSFRNYLIESTEPESGEDHWGEDAARVLCFFVQTTMFVFNLFSGALGHVIVSRFLYPYTLQAKQIWLPLIMIMIAPQIAKIVNGVFAMILKWTLIGRYREGTHSIYSTFYLKHWLVEQFANKSFLGRSNTAGGWNLSIGMNFMRVLSMRMLGAKISLSATITTQVSGWDLVEIGDMASVHGPHHLTAVTYVKKEMILRRQRIGRGATVNHGSVVAPGAVLKEGTFVECLSSIPMGMVCDGGRWSGVPARRIGDEAFDRTRPRHISKSDSARSIRADACEDIESADSSSASECDNNIACADQDQRSFRGGGHSRMVCCSFIYMLAPLAMLPFAAGAAILSIWGSRLLFERLDPASFANYTKATGNETFVGINVDRFHGLPPMLEDNIWFFMLLMPLYTILSEIFQLIGPVLVCRLLPCVSTPLDVPIWSWRAAVASMKMFMATKASANLGDASIQGWYLGLCGAKIGKESTMAEQTLLPETVEIGKNSFFASGNTLTSVEVDQGRYRIPCRTIIGDDCFFGNDNHVVEGIPAQTFVGLRTWVPTMPAEPSSLFGNPAMRFGRPGGVGGAPQGTCWEIFWYHFSTSFIDLFGWKILHSFEQGLSASIGRTIFPAYPKNGWYGQFVAEVFLFALVDLIGWYLVSILFVRCIYHDGVPQQNHYYSRHVMAWFNANKIRKVFKPPLQAEGTLWHASYMRMFGTKVGKRFFSPNADVMIDPIFGRLGDDVTVDYNAQVRQHSFEDNMLKWGPNWIHSGTTIMQAGMVAMSDTGEGVALMRGAVTWKGLLLEPGTAYDGAPAQPVMTTQELVMQELADPQA
mmetsp:Transcript_34692/g.112840  ORF Transcript_34692/g.112840 Transcript_34692/m.112840 type:complete len:1949 (-) Transcript_34692:95-5941(-)